jgi:hypothetical protein
MEAIEFISRYEKYLSEIEQMIKPELIPVMDELKEKDPHDLVRSDTFFLSESHARGFVWSLVIKKVKQNSVSLK